MAKDSPLRPFQTVLTLAFVCSLLVAGAAVGLRPKQEANKQLDRKINILRAAGLYTADQPVDLLFQAIEPKIISLATGEIISDTQINPQTFDQRQAAADPKSGQTLAKEQDQAGIRHLEKHSLIYLVKKDNAVDQIILPIRGKGLWSTMYGYVSLNRDFTAIRGITFYEHGETPGLGGEIENQDWQAGWHGKTIFDAAGQLALKVVKGKNSDNPSMIDGVSGATLTMNGVNNLLSFWFGEHGFKPFIDRYKNGGFKI